MGSGYADFDVEIVATAPTYAVRVLASPVGTVSAISGCQDWSGWDGLHPGSWQRTILSLDE